MSLLVLVCGAVGVLFTPVAGKLKRGLKEIFSPEPVVLSADEEDLSRQIESRLRAELEEIAGRGNAAIERVIGSRESTAAKVAAITAIVADAQEQANMRAASRCAEVCAAIHEVLGAEPAAKSARDFARQHGMELPVGHGSPRTEQVASDVERMMSR